MKRTRKTDAGDKVQCLSHLKQSHCGSSKAPISPCGSRAQNLIVLFSFISFMQKDTKSPSQVNGKDSEMNKGMTLV